MKYCCRYVMSSIMSFVNMSNNMMTTNLSVHLLYEDDLVPFYFIGSILFYSFLDFNEIHSIHFVMQILMFFCINISILAPGDHIFKKIFLKWPQLATILTYVPISYVHRPSRKKIVWSPETPGKIISGPFFLEKQEK